VVPSHHHVWVVEQRTGTGSCPTSALAVDTAANIAELSSALAGHMVTSLALLNPKPAVVALLKSLTLGEGEELRVVLVDLGLHLILFTCHPVVVNRLA
jgi:hypothetical protein